MSGVNNVTNTLLVLFATKTRQAEDCYTEKYFNRLKIGRTSIALFEHFTIKIQSIYCHMHSKETRFPMH